MMLSVMPGEEKKLVLESVIGQKSFKISDIGQKKSNIQYHT